MLNKVLNLFFKLYSEDKEAQNRGKRLAEKAKESNLSEESVAACYLYEALLKNYEFYYETLKEIESIDKKVAYLVDKITKKNNETWPQYYYRISVVPDASHIVWLIMIQELETANDDTFLRVYSNLQRVFRGWYNHIQ